MSEVPCRMKASSQNVSGWPGSTALAGHTDGRAAMRSKTSRAGENVLFNGVFCAHIIFSIIIMYMYVINII